MMLASVQSQSRYFRGHFHAAISTCCAKGRSAVYGKTLLFSREPEAITFKWLLIFQIPHLPEVTEGDRTELNLRSLNPAQVKL